jgi:hypothetical protein
MSVSPILKIRSSEGEIAIVGKLEGEFSVKNINLKLLMATSWWEGAPEFETFFNVLELTIKRALQEVYSHHKLDIEYVYTANDTMEDASQIIVKIESVALDGVAVEIDGDSIILTGNDERGFFRKLTSFRRKFEKHVQKTI